MNSEEGTESLEAFEERATRWIKSNLPSWQDPPVGDQELQQLLYDSGLAGIAFPQEYGGAGLTLEHQRRFFDTAYRLQRRVPQMYMVSIGMLGPTLLDHGSHEAKLRFLPPLLRGDEVWIQLLSEPRGGSDMAGAVTRLTKDGDSYILNGAKMWSTGALAADYGLCLCRSDWDMPKHRGLSTIAVPLSAETPGLTIQAIRTASGQPGETCQEFFDDVLLPALNLIGDENEGWTVAQRLLFHERNAVGGIGYGYLGSNRSHIERASGPYNAPSLPHLARQSRQMGVESAVGSMIADAYIESVIAPLTSLRIDTGLRMGTHKGHWGSLSKLQKDDPCRTRRRRRDLGWRRGEDRQSRYGLARCPRQDYCRREQ
jgi:alkylation response protein AidB-like acyl-CoA dehydrogenase